MTRILLVDDEAAGRQMASFNLRKAGYHVDEADSGEAALAALESGQHNLVLTDVRMPGMDGIKLAEKIREAKRETPVIVMTAHSDVETAVAAMKAGAHDFLTKPFGRNQLLVTVERTLERVRLEQENRTLRRQLAGVERPIVYRSAAMGETLKIADRVADSDATVLITGESGTGKELIARRIHARSARCDGPFVAVNCAAIPAELIEAELFGHTKGAFTGADRKRAGRFRQAASGTLFLDEVSELPSGVQSKLLRVLEERMVDVVGSDNPESVDVRILAATNRNLRREVKEGSFREDLYYRLNVVEINVPPLRQRKDDISALAEHFVAGLTGGEDAPIPTDVLAELQRRTWPGNVRELRNACERIVILGAGEELSPKLLPAENTPVSTVSDNLDPETWPPLPVDGLPLLDLERNVIQRVLEKTGGNMSEAARYLRIPRHILVYRVAKHGIARGR